MTETQTSLSCYMADIKNYGLITKDREIELAKLIKKGDENARNELVTSNLRLVITIAKSFTYSRMPIEDLIAEGNVGLLKAVDRFEPDHGAKFSSYAAWWIKQAIREYINQHKSTIRLPNQTQNKIRTIQNCSEELGKKLGRAPTYLETAQELGMRESTIYKTLLIAARQTISLDKPVSTEDGSFSAKDFIPDQETPLPGEELSKEEMIKLLFRELDYSLSEREKFIIMQRFGLTGESPKTLEEISSHLDRTRERVRQVQEEALIKLRRSLAKNC